MPELPEVETTRRGIAPHIEGRKVKQVVVRQRQLRWPIPETLEKQLTGEKVISVSRRGKYLLLESAKGWGLIHLGMSGSLRVVTNAEAPGKHDHVDLKFTNKLMLRFHDPRRFGCVLWFTESPDAHPLLESLGPEPLSDAFNIDYFFSAARKRTSPIKHFIMDSRRVVGVGNIYANEALYMAGIDPRRKAGSISKARMQKLLLAIKQVLSQAIEAGGTTLKDFVGGDGKPGYFAQSLLVYGRAGEACDSCDKPLKEIRQSQRSTVFCPRCQR